MSAPEQAPALATPALVALPTSQHPANLHQALVNLIHRFNAAVSNDESAAKKELEDTIQGMRDQIRALEQKVSVLLSGARS